MKASSTQITAPATADPLPLAWFEFADAPRPARAYRRDGAGEAPATWSVRLDQREIPFKFIRRAGPAPRPVLVLLHGLGVTVATFQGISGHLFASHDLLLVDYHSFSVKSVWPVGGVSLRVLAAGVWAVSDALGIKSVSLAGASLGGGLALLAAQQRPDAVARIALFNPAIYPQSLPFMYYVARTPILGELLMAVLTPERMINGAAWVGYTSPEKMSAALRRIYEENMRSFANRIRFMDDIRHLPGSARAAGVRPAELRQPILVIWGSQERLLKSNAARRLAGDLPAVQVAEFPDLAHAPHEEAPEIIGPVVAGFLAPAGLPLPEACDAGVPARQSSKVGTPGGR